VLQAEALDDAGRPMTTGLAPGTLVAIDAAGPVISTSPGAIRLLRVIPEGRAPMSGAEFAKASTARR